MERMNNCEYTYSHKVNDYVMYKKEGICKIIDIRSENFSGMGDKIYYVMQNVYDENSILYVPVDCKEIDKNMRHILSVEEINSIITASGETENYWIDDSKMRTLRFEQILNQGDRAEILWIVKTLSLYKLKLEEQKKKLYSSDMKIFTTAQKMITEEFAFALDIPKTEVTSYIIDRIEKTKNREAV